jgi:P-type Ca2+ transporter type 2C
MDKLIDISQFSGLSEQEAAKKLQVDGFNELPSQKKQSNFSTLFRVLSEPMLLLLIGCGLIYLFMGEVNDTLMLLSCIFVVIGITYYQERKTEKTLEALRSLSSPRALVIRNGMQIRISGRDVVEGDIIIIREGDRISADAVVLSSENLSVDESLLTGESSSVRKSEWDGKLKQHKPGGDDLSFVYSGSLVVSGRGVVKVEYTGSRTEIGKIGKSLEKIKVEETLLHIETAKIVRLVAIIGIILCVLVVLAYIFIQGNITRGLLAGLTLSMAILPEEFPVVLLIFLTLGAWRISKRNVLTRHSAAIETLGAATVLCTDKTGTLTLNKMELAGLYAEGSFYGISNSAKTDLSEKFHPLLEYGILACQKDPYDSIEKEINQIGNKYLNKTQYLHKNWNLVKEYPLSKELLALSHVWQSPDKKEFIIASKGAPEAIINLCHVSSDETTEILKQVNEMSKKGLRVLGVAQALFSMNELPKNQHDFAFRFVGLFGFIDPERTNVPDAVVEAYNAGMRVIMITGDYPGTAQYIAKKIGIKNPENFITGEELEKMSKLDLREKIITNNIFARVVPEQKLAIVNALKANDEIVAMTGDGVNDAPALKSAHIGIAMGERGTDVAREASSLVLLNDDFSSIVVAVRLGRRIYDNLKRAMGYILAVHVPIAGMSILPLIFNFPPVLLPAHIAFLELIIDPACSMVFESERSDSRIMKRPPRNLHKPMFDSKTVIVNILQGLGVLLTTFLLFAYMIKSGKGEIEARTFAFASLVLSNLLLIVVNLSWSKNIHQILFSANKTLLAVIVGALSGLMMVIYIPFLSSLFHLTALHFDDFVLIVFVVYISIAWFEMLKFFSTTKILIKFKEVLE